MVPIERYKISSLGILDFPSTDSNADAMPLVTSGVVGDLCQAITLSEAGKPTSVAEASEQLRITASVFVPFHSR